MKKQIIELINSCISNKEYMLNKPVRNNCGFIQNIEYSNKKCITAYLHDPKYVGTDGHFKSRYARLITKKHEDKHFIKFHFDDSPSITISPKESDGFYGTAEIDIPKKFLWFFEYMKKTTVKIINSPYKYILYYGVLTFEISDEEVDTIVNNYNRNYSKFTEEDSIQRKKELMENYPQQIEERIKKYSN